MVSEKSVTEPEINESNRYRSVILNHVIGKSMSMPNKAKQQAPHRTSLQTAALVYVILHGFIFWAIARSMPSEETTLALILFALTALASVIAGVAMWNWKRWGLYLYVGAGLALAGVVLLKTMSLMMVFGALLPMMIVVTLLNPVLKEFR